MSVEILIPVSLGGIVGWSAGVAGIFVLVLTIDWPRDAPFPFLFWSGAILGTSVGLHLGCAFFLCRLYMKRQGAALIHLPGSQSYARRDTTGRFRLSTLMLLIVIAALSMALIARHRLATRREAELEARFPNSEPTLRKLVEVTRLLDALLAEQTQVQKELMEKNKSRSERGETK
jgi:hypothetical protein